MTLYEHYEKCIFMRYPARTRALREYAQDITQRRSEDAHRLQSAHQPRQLSVYFATGGCCRLVHVHWGRCINTPGKEVSNRMANIILALRLHSAWKRGVRCANNYEHTLSRAVKDISNLMVTRKMPPPLPSDGMHTKLK